MNVARENSSSMGISVDSLTLAFYCAALPGTLFNVHISNRITVLYTQADCFDKSVNADGELQQQQQSHEINESRKNKNCV